MVKPSSSRENAPENGIPERNIKPKAEIVLISSVTDKVLNMVHLR